MPKSRTVTGDDNAPVEPFVRRVLSLALTAPGFTAIAAVFGISVLIAVLYKFSVSLVVLVFGVVLAILLAVLYLCFSWVVKIRTGHKSLLAGILAYTVVGVVSASIVLGFSSSFFDQPLPIKTLIVAKLGTQADAKVLLEEKTKSLVSKASSSERYINKIIISETITPPGLQTINLVNFLRMQRSSVGYHFIIDRNGLVYPMTDVSTAVGHTSGHNKDSVGIGLEHNAGEQFPQAQIAGLEKLLASLAQGLNLDPDKIISKEEIDPARYKRDITPLLPGIRDAVRRQVGT